MWRSYELCYYSPTIVLELIRAPHQTYSVKHGGLQFGLSAHAQGMIYDINLIIIISIISGGITKFRKLLLAVKACLCTVRKGRGAFSIYMGRARYCAEYQMNTLPSSRPVSWWVRFLERLKYDVITQQDLLCATFGSLHIAFIRYQRNYMWLVIEYHSSPGIGVRLVINRGRALWRWQRAAE